MNESKKSLVAPVATLSFPALFRAKSFDGQPEKYSCTLIFDEAAQGTPEFAALKEAARNAVREKWADKVPANMRSPFRSGEEKSFEGYGPGKIFINVSSKQKPRVVDAQVRDVTDESKAYPGCRVRASLGVYAYDNKGNKGVAFGLRNVQIVGDGPRLGGGSSPKDDFAPVQGGPTQQGMNLGDDEIPF